MEMWTGRAAQKRTLKHILATVSSPPLDTMWVSELMADFDKYVMLRTIQPTDYKLSKNHRLIFIGDIHGSYDPLE